MASEVAKTCGAMGRKGTPCRRPAGWGTDHVGFGTCKLHLGASAKHGRSAARAEALHFARGQLGQELDVDPLEGVLIAVRLALGVVDHWRHRLAEPDAKTDSLYENYSRALMDYTRICDIAVKAGVSERQIKILERVSDQLSLLFEEAIAAMGDLSVEQRRRGTLAYSHGLARLEAPVLDGTAEDVAA